MSVRPALVRATAIGVAHSLVTALLLLLAPTATAAIPVPKPPVRLPAEHEDPARYVGQVSCEPSTKPGTLAFRQMLLDTYGTSSIGTLRSCSTGGRSEHKDGRALDWMLNAAKPAEKAKADGFLGWLLGKDAAGVSAGNAHRLGVMYVIWNGRTWQSWTGAWKTYTGSNPHTDHVHISLSWDGAMKRTSMWTGTVAKPYDYGPCQKYVGELAPRYSTPRYTPCPPPVPRRATSFPRLWDGDSRADVVAYDSTGSMAIFPGNGAGAFSRPATIGQGWQTMSKVTAVGDWDKNGRRDLVAADSDGRLYLYTGDGNGGFAGTRREISRGWNSMTAVLGIGDLDGDGNLDMLARRASDGAAFAYPGNGKGGWGTVRQVGSLAGRDLLAAVGDWDGDGRPDLLSRDPSGVLYLHSGTGTGGLASGRAIGRGWGVFTAIVGTGDFSGDGRPDVLAKHRDGSLWLYRGNGKGGWGGGGEKLGGGWSRITLAG